MLNSSIIYLINNYIGATGGIYILYKTLAIAIPQVHKPAIRMNQNEK